MEPSGDGADPPFVVVVEARDVPQVPGEIPQPRGRRHADIARLEPEVVGRVLAIGALQELGVLGRRQGKVLGHAVGALAAECGEDPFARGHGHSTASRGRSSTSSPTMHGLLKVQRRGPVHLRAMPTGMQSRRRRPAGAVRDEQSTRAALASPHRQSWNRPTRLPLDGGASQRHAAASRGPMPGTAAGAPRAPPAARRGSPWPRRCPSPAGRSPLPEGPVVGRL